MTKLRWDKVRQKPADPGNMIAPPEDFELDKWVPPRERERIREKAAAANRRLLQRSEERRFEAMIKKFGLEKAVYLGVPASFIKAFLKNLEERKAYAQKMQEKAMARKLRRAERRVLEASGTSSAKKKKPSRE